MKKFYVLVVFVIGLISKGISQNTMSDYSYIIVSEQFEFQDKNDKYELNSLTKFLFNKYGFHAFFDREVPKEVKRCDGIWADVEGSPGFITTKVEIVIRDCNGVEVFRSTQGTSKLKEYKKAYYEAIREAFKSIRILYVNQKPISVYEDEVITKEEEAIAKEPKKNVATAIIIEEEIVEKPKGNTSIITETNTLENLPSAKFSNYSNEDKTFLLRKTKNGYSFYEESNESEDGLLLIGKIVVLETSINFTDTKNTVYEARFDASENLIIEKGTSTIIYKLEN